MTQKHRKRLKNYYRIKPGKRTQIRWRYQNKIQMILEIGVDLVEVKRIKEICLKWGDKFEKRVFTPREITYCNSKKSRHQSLASRFAAKEAVFKALGTGWSLGLHWQDVEVVNDSLGKPSIILRGEAKERAELMGAQKVLVSLSHTKQYAVAYVVLIGDLR